MSAISQINSSIYHAAYEHKLHNANETNEKKDTKLKDSLALSNKVSLNLPKDSNAAALKKIAESQPDIRTEKVSLIKTQIENGTYSINDKIDTISDNIISSMLA